MIPLSERMRPKTIEDYIGQDHLLGSQGILTKIIGSGSLPSMIFWGPPGVGKTTIANILASTLDRPFFSLSAINSGVKDIREVIERASSNNMFNQSRPILFIDEIHRFSKSQQDSLLGAVEKGTITLIGATTENPSFEVISALLSRCQVYTLKHLESEFLKGIVDRAIEHDELLKKLSITVKSYDALNKYSGGDARKLLNIFEMVVNHENHDEVIEIDDEKVVNILQNNIGLYDKQGEMHYDIISAFIKSIRGSDPDAAVYYMARMLVGGEDPIFICRRMLILASEDIGLANSNAMLLANACFQTVHQIGMPEARIPMSQLAIYLACSPKSNSAYLAINTAMQVANDFPNIPVPLHLRNAPTSLMKDLDYGKNYKYPHDYENSYVNEDYLPKELIGKKFYNPKANPAEMKSKEHLDAIERRLNKS
jgi:putative ATPase